MERNPKCYVYEPGKYVATVRQIGTSSVAVTVPKQMAKNLRLRPGMEVMVTIEPATPKMEEKPEEASQ